MNRCVPRCIPAIVLAAAGSTALADIEVFTATASFTSDAEPSKPMVTPSFDTQAGRRVLSAVMVEVIHGAAVDISADNDDPFKGAGVRARMIRSWDLVGPGVTADASKTIRSPRIDLLPDDGDRGDRHFFDVRPPDGIVFDTLRFNNESAGTFFPDPSLYATFGRGSVGFDASASLMVNDLQFQGTPPDAWQLQVENPKLTIAVRVTYIYENVPTPGSGAVLALAAIACRQRRRG